MNKRRDGNQTIQFPQELSDKRIYLCDICLRTFETGTELRQHRKLHSNKVLHTDKECQEPRKASFLSTPNNFIKIEKLESFKLLRGTLQNGFKSKFDKNLLYHSSARNNLDRYRDVSKTESLEIEEMLKPDTKTDSKHETNTSYKYCCAECGKTYRTKYSLRIHLNGHFGIKEYKCPKCDIRLSQKSGLKAHMRIHTGEKPYTCEICNMRFTQQVSRQHMSKHTGEKLFKCDICPAEFGSQTVLTTHKISKHTLLRPFKCDTCKKTFADKHYLTKHKAIHRLVRPYPCTKCEKSFITKSNLRRHLEIHTVRTSHACTVCSKSYCNSSSLLYHMTTHSEERKFLCGICNQQLASKQNLEKHMVLHARSLQDKKINEKSR